MSLRSFNKAVHDEVNIILTNYNTASKYLGDLIQEYCEREQLLYYSLVIDEEHLLLQHICSIEITKK